MQRRCIILDAPDSSSVQQQPVPLELGRLWPHVSRLRCLSSMICCVHALYVLVCMLMALGPSVISNVTITSRATGFRSE